MWRKDVRNFTRSYEVSAVLSANEYNAYHEDAMVGIGTMCLDYIECCINTINNCDVS